MREKERGRGRGGVGGRRRVRGGIAGRDDDSRWKNTSDSQQVIPKDLTHYFFSNFPENWGEKELWKVFQRYDSVWEVYISPRRDKKGKRFGFVRFQGVRNPRKLEQELDSIVIGNVKMHVNFPRFAKQPPTNVQKTMEGPKKGAKHNEGGRRSHAMVVDHGDRNMTQAGGGTMKGDNHLVRERKSYAMVVKSNLDRKINNRGSEMNHKVADPKVEEWRGPAIPEGGAWLKRSMVGILKNLDVVQSLQDAAMLNGFTHIQVRYMGDDKVLLTGPEGFNLAEALLEEENGMDEVFEAVYPWSSAVVSTSRVVWVRCHGAPLHMWTKECLSEFVRPTGMLVSIDKNTESFANVEFARIQIKTNHPGIISHHRRLYISGREYSINTIEEGSETTLTVACHCGDDPTGENDDDSHRSFIGTNQFGGFSMEHEDGDDEFSEEDEDETVPETQIQGPGDRSVEDSNVNPTSAGEFTIPRSGEESTNGGNVFEGPSIEQLLVNHVEDAENMTGEDSEVRNLNTNKNVSSTIEVWSTNVSKCGQEFREERLGQGTESPVSLTAKSVLRSEKRTHDRGDSENITLDKVQTILGQSEVPVPCLNVCSAHNEEEARVGSQERREDAEEEMQKVNQSIQKKGATSVIPIVATSNSFAALCKRINTSASEEFESIMAGSKGTCSKSSEHRRSLRLKGYSSSQSVPDSIIQQQLAFWLGSNTADARALWGLGKEIGVSHKGNEDEAISRLIGLEQRDADRGRPTQSRDQQVDNEVDQ